jgi:hypothetical protein
MSLAAQLTTTAGSQVACAVRAACAVSAGDLAAITRPATDFQPTGAGHYCAGHYCAGSLAVFSAAIIPSRPAVACTHDVIGGDVIICNAAIFQLSWLYPCS